MRIEHLYSRETNTPFGIDSFDDVAGCITQREELHLAGKIEHKICISCTYQLFELLLEPVDVRPQEVHCEEQAWRTHIIHHHAHFVSPHKYTFMRGYVYTYEMSASFGAHHKIVPAHTSIRPEFLLSAYILKRDQVRDADRRRRCLARRRRLRGGVQINHMYASPPSSSRAKSQLNVCLLNLIIVVIHARCRRRDELSRIQPPQRLAVCRLAAAGRADNNLPAVGRIERLHVSFTGYHGASRSVVVIFPLCLGPHHHCSCTVAHHQHHVRSDTHPCARLGPILFLIERRGERRRDGTCASIL